MISSDRLFIQGCAAGVLPESRKKALCAIAEESLLVVGFVNVTKLAEQAGWSEKTVNELVYSRFDINVNHISFVENGVNCLYMTREAFLKLAKIIETSIDQQSGVFVFVKKLFVRAPYLMISGTLRQQVELVYNTILPCVHDVLAALPVVRLEVRDELKRLGKILVPALLEDRVCINLEYVFGVCGYSEKGTAKRALVNRFHSGRDYEIHQQRSHQDSQQLGVDSTSKQHRNSEQIFLSSTGFLLLTLTSSSASHKSVDNYEIITFYVELVKNIENKRAIAYLMYPKTMNDTRGSTTTQLQRNQTPLRPFWAGSDRLEVPSLFGYGQNLAPTVADPRGAEQLNPNTQSMVAAMMQTLSSQNASQNQFPWSNTVITPQRYGGTIGTRPTSLNQRLTTDNFSQQLQDAFSARNPHIKKNL